MTNEVQDVKKFFHGYASDFDSIYGHTTTRGSFDKLMDKLFRRSMLLRFNETLLETAKPSIHAILDVGCGSGVYCVEFLKQGKEVVGLDIAEGMLEIAKQKTSDYRDSGKISFILSGYMEYEFQRKFDAAVLMGFFDYIKEPVELIKKLKKDVTKEIYMDSTTIIETSWVDNKLVFQENETFSEVALKMDRRYGVHIIFSDEEVGDQRIYGSFTEETIDQALDALREVFKFNYKKIGNDIIITQ